MGVLMLELAIIRISRNLEFKKKKIYPLFHILDICIVDLVLIRCISTVYKFFFLYIHYVILKQQPLKLYHDHLLLISIILHASS